jgi:Tfp pilus assembly protein PilV
MKANQIQPPLAKTEAGFSMIEVLVAGLVIFFFLIGSLQAIVLATALRVQAQTKVDAMNLINQEADAVKFQAFQLYRGVDTDVGYPYSTTAGTTAANAAKTACANQTYGNNLRQNVISTYPANGTVSGYSTLLNGATITRTYSPQDTGTAGNPNDDTTKSNSLQITWTVTKDGKQLGTMTTEVLPDGALYCPP